MSTCLLRGRSTPAILAMCYPCLCLCFEFIQITRTTPLRCTILHLSQIFFTDALTFMTSCPQGLKPHLFFDLIGTIKTVPCYLQRLKPNCSSQLLAYLYR